MIEQLRLKKEIAKHQSLQSHHRNMYLKHDIAINILKMMLDKEQEEIK